MIECLCDDEPLKLFGRSCRGSSRRNLPSKNAFGLRNPHKGESDCWVAWMHCVQATACLHPDNIPHWRPIIFMVVITCPFNGCGQRQK
jgi:hypothetical protein